MKELSFKDQRAYDDDWIDYINDNYNPKGLNWDRGGNDISMKCLSFASSTMADWITLQSRGVLYNYTNILNNRTESGHNWREMEQVYFNRVSIFDPKYDFFPILDDIFVTHEDVPYDIEGYADIIIDPPSWYQRPDSELNYPKNFNYTVEPDEYLSGFEYEPIPTSESRIKNALNKYGILYAHVKNKIGRFRLPIHAVVLIGYGKYDGKDVFWYHDSYDGDDYGLVNVSLYTDISGSWMLNQTKSLSGNYDSALFNITNLGDGSFNWNCLVLDNASQSSWGENRTVNVKIGLEEFYHDVPYWTVNGINTSRYVIITFSSYLNNTLRLGNLTINESDGEFYYTQNMSEISYFEVNSTDPPLLVYAHKFRVKPREIFDYNFTVGNIAGLNFSLEYFYSGFTYTQKLNQTIEVLGSPPS